MNSKCTQKCTQIGFFSDLAEKSDAKKMQETTVLQAFLSGAG